MLPSAAAYDEACRQFRETGTVDPAVQEAALDFVNEKYISERGASGVSRDEAIAEIREMAWREAKAKPIVSIDSARKLSPRRTGSAR